ncbi:hypothetical protein M0R04_11160 [Candidatus Dojkabacteria bacterium]|jgi:hypothetical protein|nr:hypothetical protein [Candidatus Dojkabacteria bacterium]
MYGTQMFDPLAEVRTALTTTTNAVGGDTRTTLGGNEIQKMIDRVIVDTLNRSTGFRQFLKRTPTDQLGAIHNLRTDLGSTGKAAFYSDGAGGTPYPSTKVQIYFPVKSYRSDYEVTGLAQSAMFINALEDEARDALDALRILEEKAILCGANTSAYGFASSFNGLLQYMNSYVTLGDTTSVGGIARASSKTYLDVALVAANSTTSAAFSMALLDSAIDKSLKQDDRMDNKVFLMSVERKTDISQLLQTQQRYPMTFVETNFGFRVEAYRMFPLVASRFMDKNGLTSTGSDFTLSYADNAMYFIPLDSLDMVILNGVDFTHVPISGSDSNIRYDVTGGYFKTYGTLRMKRFDNCVLIYNLSAP